MNRTILIIIALLIAFGAAGAFAFYQTRNLESLQNNSTEVVAALENSSTQAVAALEGSSTQAVNYGIATETALADSAYATSTQAAQEFNDAAATSSRAALVNNANSQRVYATGTQSANDAAATSTQAENEAIETGTQAADSANATGTALADSSYATGTALADFAYATGTDMADSANATNTQSAEEYSNVVATQVAFSTNSANIFNTQNAVATSAAEDASHVQATLQAQNLVLVGTLEASGWTGDGVFGESAILPDNFELYQGGGYEIALPESFVGADLNDNPRSFFNTLDDLGFESATEYLRAQDENFLFFGIDTTLVNGVPRATVSIVRDTPPVETTLGDYLGSAYVGIQGNAALIITDEIAVNGQVTGRSIVEQQFANGSVRQMQFIFQVENSFYVITFTTPVSEFVVIRPALEQIAGTFRLRN